MVSCQSQPHIESFDAIGWQSDTNGCQGFRLDQLEVLMDDQQELLGWNEPALTGYLGSPDYRELYVRNQKFLIYYLEPTWECGSVGKENPLRMYVRIDALGQSKEISLRNR
ncbi:MAG: hypothetical protein DHS20C17_30890 [Cyclobacteriaceae bacterium]|nr:MAG: hypothetical protein DHS20C17_30890 [Cyclobacteriaceae bacterium]